MFACVCVCLPFYKRNGRLNFQKCQINKVRKKRTKLSANNNYWHAITQSLLGNDPNLQTNVSFKSFMSKGRGQELLGNFINNTLALLQPIKDQKLKEQ